MTPYVGCRKMRDQNKLKSTIHGVGCSTTTLHLLALLRGVVNFLLKKKKPLYFPPPYSPDLVPSHFFLLLRLTKGIKEGNMMRSPRVTNNLETPVKCQTTHFTKCFCLWSSCWAGCVKCPGANSDKDTKCCCYGEIYTIHKVHDCNTYVCLHHYSGPILPNAYICITHRCCLYAYICVTHRCCMYAYIRITHRCYMYAYICITHRCCL